MKIHCALLEYKKFFYCFFTYFMEFSHPSFHCIGNKSVKDWCMWFQHLHWKWNKNLKKKDPRIKVFFKSLISSIVLDVWSDWRKVAKDGKKLRNPHGSTRLNNLVLAHPPDFNDVLKSLNSNLNQWTKSYYIVRFKPFALLYFHREKKPDYVFCFFDSLLGRLRIIGYNRKSK